MSRFVRVTRGAPGSFNANGLEVLRLALWDNGKEIDAVTAVSGIAGRQNFRALAGERRGVLEPCPEGRYYNIGPLEWAGNPGDYQTVHSAALGPVVIEIYGERAIMLHVDGNVPGSAGCLCPCTMAEMRTVVAWWVIRKPDFLECDWGLGTIPRPSRSGEEQLHRVKLYSKPGKTVAYRDGKSQDAVTALLEFNSGKLALTINGAKLPMDQIESVSVEVAYKAGK